MTKTQFITRAFAVITAVGALVVTADLAEEVPALPVAGVDPTGAGDAFWVAYLAARADGRGPIEAARGASAFVAGLLAARE